MQLTAALQQKEFFKKKEYKPYTLVTVLHPDGVFRSCGTKEGTTLQEIKFTEGVKKSIINLKEINGVFYVPQEESGWACVGEKGSECIIGADFGYGESIGATFKYNKETGEVEETLNYEHIDALKQAFKAHSFQTTKEFIDQLNKTKNKLR